MTLVRCTHLLLHGCCPPESRARGLRLRPQFQFLNIEEMLSPGRLRMNRGCRVPFCFPVSDVKVPLLPSHKRMDITVFKPFVDLDTQPVLFIPDVHFANLQRGAHVGTRPLLQDARLGSRSQRSVSCAARVGSGTVSGRRDVLAAQGVSAPSIWKRSSNPSTQSRVSLFLFSSFKRHRDSNVAGVGVFGLGI